MFLAFLNHFDLRGLLLMASGLVLGGLVVGIVYALRRRAWLRRQRAAFEVKVAPLREALAARERRASDLERQLGETVQHCQWLEQRDNAASGQVVELRETLDRERKANLGFKELLQIAETRLAEVFHNLSIQALNQANAAFLNITKGEIDKYERVALQELQRGRGAMAELVNPLQHSLGRLEGKIAQLEELREQLAAAPAPAQPAEQPEEAEPRKPITYVVPAAHGATASRTEFGIEKLAGDAREISEMGQKMHDQLLDIRSHIAYLGKFLDGARDVYRETVGPAGREPEQEPAAPEPGNLAEEPHAAKSSPEEPPEPAAPPPDANEQPNSAEAKTAPQSPARPEPLPNPGKPAQPVPARPATRIARKPNRKKRPAARREKPPVKMAPPPRIEEADDEDRDGLVIDFDSHVNVRGNGSPAAASRVSGIHDAGHVPLTPMHIQAGDIARDFLSILLEGIPFIFLGTLVSGIIDSFLPSGMFAKLLPRRASAAVLVSGLLGAVFPMCECGIVPVIRRLIQKGLPVSCAITYMLSAPVINPVVAFSTWSAFKGDRPWFMASSRLIMAYMIAVAAGLIISKIPVEKILNARILRGAVEAAKKNADRAAGGGSRAAPDSLFGRIKAAMRTAMRDFLDVALYFTIGIAITAILKQQAGRELILPLAKGSEVVAVGSMMGFAFILSLCSTSDAFIASTLNMFSKASRLAFLVFGPMVDVKLIFMYSSVFRRGFVLWLVIGIFLLVGGLSLAWGLN